MATLNDLAPFLSADLKKEIEAIADIQKLFPGKKMAEISKQFKKFVDARRVSADGMFDRIKYYRDNQWPEGENQETPEAIVLDYAKMKAADVKALGKKLNFDLTNAKDPEETAALTTWLKGGPKPPTAAEKAAHLIKEQADKILDLMEKRRLKQISIDECVSQCKAIVDVVSKQFKAPGLLALGEQIQVVCAPKDTAAKLTKYLKAFFDDRCQKWKRDLDIDHA